MNYKKFVSYGSFFVAQKTIFCRWTEITTTAQEKYSAKQWFFVQAYNLLQEISSDITRKQER